MSSVDAVETAPRWQTVPGNLMTEAECDGLAAKRLLAERDRIELELSRHLSRLRKRWARSQDRDRAAGKFERYARDELGVESGERARQLAAMYEFFTVRCGATHALLQGVPIRGLLEIQRVATPENVRMWLDRAREEEPSDLTQLVAAEVRDRRERHGEVCKRVTFKLHASQQEIVEAALDYVQRNKTAGHLLAPNECLAHVAMGFLADRQTRDQRPNAQLRLYLYWFERVFGGKFIWITSEEAIQVLSKAIHEHPDLFPEVTPGSFRSNRGCDTRE